MSQRHKMLWFEYCATKVINNNKETETWDVLIIYDYQDISLSVDVVVVCVLEFIIFYQNDNDIFLFGSPYIYGRKNVRKQYEIDILKKILKKAQNDVI